MNELATSIRGPSKEDLPFIYTTWLRNYRYSSTGFTQPIDKEIYYAYHNLIIGGILNRDSRILLCVDKQDAKVIYGYLVYEYLPNLKPVYHYGYVKKAFRGLGIFRSLLAESKFNLMSSEYTHQTEDFKRMVDKGKWECKYNPYLVA